MHDELFAGVFERGVHAVRGAVPGAHQFGFGESLHAYVGTPREAVRDGWLMGNRYASLESGAVSHKKVDKSRSRILNLYYSNNVCH